MDINSISLQFSLLLSLSITSKRYAPHCLQKGEESRKQELIWSPLFAQSIGMDIIGFFKMGGKLIMLVNIVLGIIRIFTT